MDFSTEAFLENISYGRISAVLISIKKQAYATRRMMSEFHVQRNVMMMKDVAEEIACHYANLWNALLRSKYEAMTGPVVAIMKECVEDIYGHLSDLILPSRLEIVDINRMEHRSASQQMYPVRYFAHRSDMGSHESRESYDRPLRNGASVLSFRCSRQGSTTQKLKISAEGT